MVLLGQDQATEEMVLHPQVCLPGAVGPLLRSRVCGAAVPQAGPTFCLQCASLDRAEMITVAAMKSSSRSSRIRLKLICQRRTHTSVKRLLLFHPINVDNPTKGLRRLFKVSATFLSRARCQAHSSDSRLSFCWLVGGFLILNYCWLKGWIWPSGCSLP